MCIWVIKRLSYGHKKLKISEPKYRDKRRALIIYKGLQREGFAYALECRYKWEL